ncbi:exodeoxyribonuclease VII small subunit [Syntrophomonas erecta]
MEELKFEEALKQLEAIVERLESGELALEESITLYEKGIALSMACQKQLKQAEGKIQRLTKNLNGDLELIDQE